MMYRARFHGREIGAIGIFGQHTIEVWGDTEEQARLAIYETHEHLTGVILRPLYHIGDVVVIRGEPPEGNPYRGESLCGPFRKTALSAFKAGHSTPELSFWYAPSFGGARRIGRADVDWETSGVK
jgi:hypothetical protein